MMFEFAPFFCEYFWQSRPLKCIVFFFPQGTDRNRQLENHNAINILWKIYMELVIEVISLIPTDFHFLFLLFVFLSFSINIIFFNFKIYFNLISTGKIMQLIIILFFHPFSADILRQNFPFQYIVLYFPQSYEKRQKFSLLGYSDYKSVCKFKLVNITSVTEGMNILFSFPDSHRFPVDIFAKFFH